MSLWHSRPHGMMHQRILHGDRARMEGLLTHSCGRQARCINAKFSATDLSLGRVNRMPDRESSSRQSYLCQLQVGRTCLRQAGWFGPPDGRNAPARKICWPPLRRSEVADASATSLRRSGCQHIFLAGAFLPSGGPNQPNCRRHVRPT